MLGSAASSGVAYLDSCELVEQKNPIVIWNRSIRLDSEGAGENRGAPGNVCIFGPRLAEMQSHFFLDGRINRPRGVRGGGAALGPDAWIAHRDGDWELVESVIGSLVFQPGESVVALGAGGGGFGDPLDRDPSRVLEDVIETWISPTRARDTYGVVLTGDPTRWETVSVDEQATLLERSRLRGVDRRGDGYRTPQRQLHWWVGADIGSFPN
jgi:N-methylhydantoinase B